MPTARTADGVALHLDHVRAQGTRRGVVLCCHAMMTDARALGARRPDGFAATLAATGLEVFVLDFRGHGASVPPTADGAGWTFDDLAQLDLPAAVATVAAVAGVAPTALAVVGHALGGLVALAAIATGRVPSPRALALVATSAWLPGPDGPSHRRALLAAADAVAGRLGRLPARALRLGRSDEAPGVVAQLAGWARTGRWTSREGVDYLEALAAVTTPVLGIAGDRDRLCRPADAAALLDRLPASGPLRVVPRAAHASLLTDPAHAPLWHDLAAWLAAPDEGDR